MQHNIYGILSVKEKAIGQHIPWEFTAVFKNSFCCNWSSDIRFLGGCMKSRCILYKFKMIFHTKTFHVTLKLASFSNLIENSWSACRFFEFFTRFEHFSRFQMRLLYTNSTSIYWHSFANVIGREFYILLNSNQIYHKKSTFFHEQNHFLL